MSEPKHYCKDCKNFLEFGSTSGICWPTKDYTQIFWTCDKWEYISYEEREELKKRAREYRKKKREAEQLEEDEMAYRYVNPSAMCPFYRMEDKKMIVCEGPEEGLGINVTNDGRDGQVKEYKRKYCYNNWQACALAKSLTEIAEKNS